MFTAMGVSIGTEEDSESPEYLDKIRYHIKLLS